MPSSPHFTPPTPIPGPRSLPSLIASPSGGAMLEARHVAESLIPNPRTVLGSWEFSLWNLTALCEREQVI